MDNVSSLESVVLDTVVAVDSVYYVNTGDSVESVDSVYAVNSEMLQEAGRMTKSLTFKNVIRI